MEKLQIQSAPRRTKFQTNPFYDLLGNIPVTISLTHRLTKKLLNTMMKNLISPALSYLSIFTLFCCISCQVSDSVIREHVAIDVYTYKNENEKKAAAMPEIKSNSSLKAYKRRFEYLLINVSEIHLPEKAEERNQIFDLYPHKSKMKELYLEKFAQDKKLVAYFEETLAPINNPGLAVSKVYTQDELMEVASKFFYCDQILPDTTVQAHICIGLNGIKEAVWEKDYTLLAAFCFEGIFNDFEQETSAIWDSFVIKKQEACQKFRPNITTLDQYLLDVRLDLFERMKLDEILKKVLLDYYELNKGNLAFRITD